MQTSGTFSGFNIKDENKKVVSGIYIKMQLNHFCLRFSILYELPSEMNLKWTIIPLFYSVPTSLTCHVHTLSLNVFYSPVMAC